MPTICSHSTSIQRSVVSSRTASPSPATKRWRPSSTGAGTRARPYFGFWAAIENGTGRFLGWFHFRAREGAPADEPELGYRLVSSAWGKGYGTEGSIALIDHGFANTPITRVYAETMAINIGSRRVMEKAGMRLIREFHSDWPVRIEGDEHGDVEYAITRAEWESSRPST